MKRNCSVAVLACLISIAAAGRSANAVDRLPVRAVKPLDRSTPQNVVSEFQHAFRNRNWSRAFRTMTGDSQDTMLGFQVIVVKRRLKGTNRKLAMQIFEKHGVRATNSDMDDFNKLTKGFRGEFRHVREKPSLFGQLSEFFAKLDKANIGESPTDLAAQMGKLKFSNFQIVGSTAFADWTVNGRKELSQFIIIRLNNSWYVDLSTTIRLKLGDRGISPGILRGEMQ